MESLCSFRIRVKRLTGRSYDSLDLVNPDEILSGHIICARSVPEGREYVVGFRDSCADIDDVCGRFARVVLVAVSPDGR